MTEQSDGPPPPGGRRAVPAADAPKATGRSFLLPISSLPAPFLLASSAFRPVTRSHLLSLSLSQIVQVDFLPVRTSVIQISFNLTIYNNVSGMSEGSNPPEPETKGAPLRTSLIMEIVLHSDVGFRFYSQRPQESPPAAEKAIGRTNAPMTLILLWQNLGNCPQKLSSSALFGSI